MTPGYPSLVGGWLAKPVSRKGLGGSNPPPGAKTLCLQPLLAFFSSLYLKQLVRWSLTMPTACMKA
jgi:hypothetical protein